MQADTFALDALKYRRNQLKRQTSIKKKSTLFDINSYRKKLNNPDEALLSVIQEDDRASYPEERV